MRKGIVRTKWNNTSVKNKILISFMIPIIFIIATNVFMYLSTNEMMKRVNQIYVTNVTLNDLSENLSLLQGATRTYLENKSTVALNDYYGYEQDYRNLLEKLDSNGVDNKTRAMQENIVHQSECYLSLTENAITAKRGRNIVKYKESYERSEVLFQDIQNCIYSLNSDKFRTNTVRYGALLTSLKQLEIAAMIILVFIGLVNIVVVTFVTGNMIKPLTELSQAADEVANGNFDVDIKEYESEDEIGVVSKTFMQMVRSIKQYISEIRESMLREREHKEHELVMENRMKEVQLRSLQAQINPHFLFNTLNAGSQLAMMEGADKTTEFIQNMADFFRYNIKKINNNATVGEEILMVDRYVYILNVRFTGEIHFSKEVDEDILSVTVPSMILQPIIENAVNYGIREIDWEGHIDLRAYKEGNMVYISIKDNGIGMSEEKISKILSGEGVGETSSTNSGSNGIGLGNVIERLRIFTGSENVMDIYSEGENKGTEFVIKIPTRV
ncbi:MAG: sensor histidine kinase [Lachnospiraceae bacterium]|nr:sensor histidine kinase [Lachnospiraceae bacterium]